MSIKYKKLPVSSQSSNIRQSISSKEHGDQDILLNSLNVVEQQRDLSKPNNDDHVQFAKINIENDNSKTNIKKDKNYNDSNINDNSSDISFDSTGILPSPENQDINKIFKEKDLQQTTKETISVIKILIIIGISSNFWYSCRLYVWILYAQSFFGGKTLNDTFDGDDSTEGPSIQTSIVIVWYCFFISKGINSIFSSMVSDYVGFDRIMVIQTFLISLGIFFESMASSFTTLAIGVLVVSLAGNVGVNIKGFIAIMLPNQEAIQYTGYTYAFMVITYLTGPVVSGICAHYFGYRSCFYLSFIVACISFIILFIFIRKKQKLLTSKQLNFLKYYEDNNIPDVKRFPQCCEYIRKQKKLKKKQEMKNNDLTDNLKELTNNNKTYCLKLCHKFKNTIPKLNKIKLSELFVIIIQMAFVCGCESILGSYYTAYMQQRFRTPIKKSTLQIAAACVAAAVGNVLPALFLKKYPIFKKHLEWIIIAAYVISIFLGVFICPNAEHENEYWLWTPLTIALLGFVVMSVESIFVTIIPKKDAGKLNGLLGGIMAFVAGTGTFVVGIMWDTKGAMHGWIWYTCALFYGIGGVMMVFFKCIQHYAPNQCAYEK